MCSATAGPTRPSSIIGDIGRPSGSTARVGHLERRALVDGRGDLAEARVSSRLTTNAGASLTSTHDFFSALPTANAVASVASSVCSPRTISSSGMHGDRVEEVEARPPARGARGPAAISVTDSEEVLVARTQVSDDDGLDLGEDLLLDLQLLEDGLDHEVGVGEAVLVDVEPVTSALSRLALSGVTRPLASSLSISPWT